MSQYPMTARGAQMLRDELNELKTKTRPRMSLLPKHVSMVT